MFVGICNTLLRRQPVATPGSHGDFEAKRRTFDPILKTYSLAVIVLQRSKIINICQKMTFWRNPLEYVDVFQGLVTNAQNRSGKACAATVKPNSQLSILK